MTTERTLHDRLADLASQAPAGGPALDLWGRGRRIARRRRAGTAVITAVVVLVLGGVVATSWQRDRAMPAPAGPVEQGMRLPDRFYEPSPWLPSTEDAGPLGRVSAVLGSSNGRLAGVSATDGEYRYLDLPGWSVADDTWGSNQVALSGDGRFLAYWARDGQEVVGLAVYDTESGTSRTWSLRSRYGIGVNGLTWVGDQVWAQAGSFDDAQRTGTSDGQTHVWDLGTGEQSSVPGGGPALPTSSTSAATLVETDGRSVSFYETPAEPARTLRTDRLVDSPVVPSPAGDRLAAAADVDGAGTFTGRTRPLVLLTPSGDRLTGRPVPSIRTNDVIAWRDEGHLVVYDNASRGYLSVDVTTGETSPLVTPTDNWTPGLQVAADAWQAPSYDAPAPPDPLDPRLAWGGSIAVVLLGGVAVVLWRRRVRP